MIAFSLQDSTIRIITTIPPELSAELDDVLSPALQKVMPRKDAMERARGWFRNCPDSDIHLLKALHVLDETDESATEAELTELLKACGVKPAAKAFLESVERLSALGYVHISRRPFTG